MRILVINGDCVQVNTSANLCHLAYLRGFVEAGHEVTLLSADGDAYQKDPGMQIPEGVRCVSRSGMSLYQMLSLQKNRLAARNMTLHLEQMPNTSHRKSLVRKLKDLVLSAYGVHGIYAPFVRRAKRFRSKQRFDLVVSLSTPVTSHLLAHELLRSRHVKADHWIQIWEDPWYSDAFGFNRKEQIFNEEKRLLSFAERVCYVSPITLENQKRLFPEAAEKMFWQPLPAYYEQAVASDSRSDSALFGYFGSYYPAARNLRPFYEAAIRTKIRVNICGDTSIRLSSTQSIHIYPRMPLERLHTFEEQTGVLVFLCNRRGGQIPGKIYQYAATDKTILFILDGTVEEKAILRGYFEPYHRFVFCDNTAEDIERTIESILREEKNAELRVPLRDFEPEKIVTRIIREG